MKTDEHFYYTVHNKRELREVVELLSKKYSINKWSDSSYHTQTYPINIGYSTLSPTTCPFSVNYCVARTYDLTLSTLDKLRNSMYEVSVSQLVTLVNELNQRVETLENVDEPNEDELVDMDELINDVMETVTYNLGDRYINKGNEYILANVDYGEIAMISIEDGNRYMSPIEVANVRNITYEEFAETTDNNPHYFTKIN